MRSFFTAVLFICSVFLLNHATAQPSAEINLSKTWNANWISAKNETGRDYGVFYFRKSISLAAKPATFIVNVSADNRYKLYVNGTLVSLGPARGDTYYWNYEKVDLAPYLVAGKNTVAAIVWNEAEFRPEAQISLRTAFIIQGNTAAEEILNTNGTWKSVRDKAYQPINGIGYPAYYVAGPGELIDESKTIKGWMANDFDDTAWPGAGTMDRGKPKGMADAFGWMLVPSILPQMERTYQRIPVLRKADGVTAPASFPATKTTITIPANTTATLLLDQTYLTNAYVTLNFSKGKNAGISLSYAEALFDNLKKYGPRKGNRNDVDGKDFAGRKDSLIADGSDGQTFTSLYWRTYRYIRLVIQTRDEPLVIDDIYGTATGFPFQRNAKLKTDNPEMQQMLDIGWRTARMDAIETYMDCPYYEQLQYIGDTRIQALVSYYNSGDDRLMRNAINLMDHSRIAEGLALSRHPSYSPQIISTFSLWYVSVLHDYWMYRPDSNFVKDKLQGERAVLDFFSKYQQADGSLKNTPYWTFVDWAGGWGYGMAPTGSKGGSAILDLQLLITYQLAAEMEAKIGMPVFAQLYRSKAAQLKQTIQNKYWDPVKKLYADTEDKNVFSQHANSLAILTGMIKGPDAIALCKNMQTDTTLTQCTIYFKYYMHQAFIKAGLGNDYMKWLDVWRENIKMGLTTWAEFSDLPNSRSDCHAWGASPNIEFFRTILGIDSYAPGFAKVKIEPHLGDLKTASGEIPHPNGKVAVDYVLDGGVWRIRIDLPQKTTGIFVWKGKTYLIKTGENLFKI
ncbi:alpha-rhamnosidase [Mucilaginibacter sp. BJC16-A38]|uniref:alpha-L-rhamnosidase-related protein n=1 Tax=Mucilaginibacter phenanthrenivorans TaxID=1234842 RepID=UPI002157C6FB|nr:alpha-L-rhamnosidase C-terminal domain-containing protein [Mucilaginibacter phenanthrenivorans]MCR8561512.1 alpha-rhamnosidase [Mucilaginibacter phenanthrenivorans]